MKNTLTLFILLANLQIVCQQAPDIRTAAAKQANLQNYTTALALATGAKGFSKNPTRALALYNEIIADPNHELYERACNDVGLFYEWGTFGTKPDIAKASQYFKMAKDAASIRGKMHLARLILTDKIPSNEEQKKQAENDLKYCATYVNGNDIALYLYSALLINRGDIEQAFDLLTQYYKPNTNLIPITPMVALQLAIGYQDGWGNLPKSPTIAAKYFSEIDLNQTSPFRSPYLARAYLYIMGLGVEKNLEKGFQLLDESMDKFDDIFLNIDALYPEINKIKDAYIQQKAKHLQELLDLDEKEKAEKEKKASAKHHKSKGKAQPQALATPSSIGEPSGGESSRAGALRAQESRELENKPKQRNIFDISKKDWGFWEANGDGSRISKIDRTNREITIDDPARNEQLIVTVDPTPYRHFVDLTELIYHPRLNTQLDTDHTFAKMLDYVIQCAGKMGQFVKIGETQPRDQIIAYVKRINNETHIQSHCKAEYTFYKTADGKQHLYHRLLRPI